MCLSTLKAQVLFFEDIRPKDRDIAQTGDFTGNYANGSGGGVINEGKF